MRRSSASAKCQSGSDLLRDQEIAATVREMAMLNVHVVPNAKIDKVVRELATASPSRGGHGGAIKIKLRAPAVEGKANAALRSLLAKKLGVPERTISIARGHKSREKLIRVDGLTDAEAGLRLYKAL